MNIINEDALDLIKSILKNNKNHNFEYVTLCLHTKEVFINVEKKVPMTQMEFEDSLNNNGNYTIIYIGDISIFSAYVVLKKIDLKSSEIKQLKHQLEKVIKLENRYNDNIYSQFRQSYEFIYNEIINFIFNSKFVSRCSYDIAKKRVLLSDSIKNILPKKINGLYVSYAEFLNYIEEVDGIYIAKATKQLIENKINYFQTEVHFKNCKYAKAMLNGYTSNFDNEGNPVIINFLVVFSGMKTKLEEKLFLKENNIEFSNNQNLGLWEFNVNERIFSINESAKKILKLKKLQFTSDEIASLIKSFGTRNYDNYLQAIDLYKKYGSIDYVIDIEEENFKYRYRFYAIKIYNNYFPEKNYNEYKIVGYVRDCSNEIVQEQIILRNERLRAIGNIASGVAHDFNNTLMAAYGYLNLLDLTDLNSEQQEYLEKLHHIASTQKDTITKLLNYVKDSNDKEEMVNCLDVLNELYQFSKSTFSKNIKINYYANCDYAIINANRNAFQSSLLNLLMNSNEAVVNNNNDAQIEIIIDNQKVKKLNGYCPIENEFKEGQYIIISINDNGEGIQEKEFKTIFQTFYTTKTDGNGIGLVNVMQTVEKYNGYLTVESKNHLTSFKLYFPVVLQKSNNVETVGSVINKVQSYLYTIMIIDDDMIINDLMKTLLTRNGYNVITYLNVEEAIQYYRYNFYRIDLVIFDMIMPIMNGDRLYMKLKEINPDIKGLLLSGLIDEEKRTYLLNNGLNAIIQKPVDINIVNNEIIKLIETIKEPLIDEKLGLYLMGNCQAAYDKLKQQFIENYEYISPYLITLANNNDSEGIRTLIHKLRGISLNIGSKELYRHTNYVDESLKNNGDFHSLYIEILKIKDITHEIICKIRSNNV